MRPAKGFTLIELLVTITIIGILASVVLLVVNPAKILENSRYTTMKANLNQVAKAAQLYELNSGTLPPDASRNIPTEFMTYLGGGSWPDGPWPGSKYDWDNWTDQTCLDGSSDIIQVSLRDVNKYQGKTYSVAGGDVAGRPQLTFYYVMSGKGVPHCSMPTCTTSCTPANNVGYCLNCPSLYTPAP
jgi:prepilin-type N-terminal cleavage/methylation domain-containing protein